MIDECNFAVTLGSYGFIGYYSPQKYSYDHDQSQTTFQNNQRVQHKQMTNFNQLNNV